jgi:hypothetical protein
MSSYTYNTVPQVRFKRNRFKYNQQHLTTMNTSDLVPFFVQEVYPGESYKIYTDVLGRTSNTFLKSPMGNIIQDVNYFFVPHRLTWEHFEEFLGANKKTAWANTEVYSVPKLTVPADFWVDEENRDKFSSLIATRLGLPIGSYEPISALPIRAFALIYDNWFRNQNVQDPIYVKTDDTNDILSKEDFATNNYTGFLPKVNKFKDRFTSALPSPQKGDAPEISFKLSADLPVQATNDIQKVTTDMQQIFYGIQPGVVVPDGSFTNTFTLDESGASTQVWRALLPGAFDNSVPMTNGITPINLWAKADNVDTGTNINVNDLRLMFATQKLLERQARGGTRYKEILLNEWGVVSPDARLQIPEFLGGRRFPITYFQVPNTAGGGNAQASISSFGHYSGNARMTKSFVEHGYIIGVSSIRQVHLYQQGIERFLSRFSKLDFFNPVFSTIGEQPVYRRELYALDTVENNALAFGYQEAWSDLRSRQNLVSGQMSSLSTRNLEVWQFGDEYTNAPILSSQFISEVPNYVDRTLAVPSTSQDQFMVQFVTHVNSIKELPLYSVPSLIDHY